MLEKKVNNKQTKLPLHIHKWSKTPLPLAQQNINMTGCPICECIITLHDHHHAETLCAKCGLVLDDMSMTSNQSINYNNQSTARLYTGSGYTASEYSFLRKKQQRLIKTFKPSRERRNLYYYNIIDIVRFELNLTKYDVQHIKQMIETVHSLRKLHSKCCAETIIIGLCRYCLLQKNVIYELTTFSNPVYIRYELSEQRYNIIEKNLERLL